MRKDITIAAEARETRGKNEAYRTRVRGLVPAVVYGAAKDPVAVSVDPKAVSKILLSSTGFNSIFNLDVTGEGSTPVIVTDYQLEPIKGRVLHFDFKRVDLSKPISVKVPVHQTGEPKGVKLQGGILETVSREIEIQCLPDDIPEHFTVDVGELMVGQSIRAIDIPLTGSMKLLSPADAVITHVTSLKAEAAEGGEAPATAEPEVIKKGKKEEAGAAPAAKGAAKPAAGGDKAKKK